MSDPGPPAGIAPAGTIITISLTRAEVVTITDALALLAVEHHRQRVLARDTHDELSACQAEADVDELRLRLERALLGA